MRCALFSAFLVALAAAGCVSDYHTLALDTDYRADCFLTCKTYGELYLASEALFDSVKSEKYLFFDLKDEGFIPIVLYANNRGDESFLLTRDDVSLILTDGTALSPVDVNTVYGEAKAPAIFSGAEEDLKMMLDYHSKDFFRSRGGVRLGSKNSIVGVVFFQIPDDREISNLSEAVMELTMTREKGKAHAESQSVKMKVAVE